MQQRGRKWPIGHFRSQVKASVVSDARSLAVDWQPKIQEDKRTIPANQLNRKVREHEEKEK